MDNVLAGVITRTRIPNMAEVHNVKVRTLICQATLNSLHEYDTRETVVIDEAQSTNLFLKSFWIQQLLMAVGV